MNIWKKKIRKKDLIPAVFLHIQKTAGTSLIEIIRAHYGNNIITHGDFSARNYEDLVDIAFISGHFGFYFAKPFIHNRYSFTILRDPVERVLSLYYFCRNQNSSEYPIYHLARTLDIENFLRQGMNPGRIHSHIWNHQVWTLASGRANPEGQESHEHDDEEKLLDLAISHLEKLSYVGFTESFEKDSVAILAALGIPVPETKIVANTTPGRLGRNDVSERTLELIAELTRLDQIMYAKAWSRRHG